MLLSACEWEIVVAAYAYELLDSSTMSDYTYDLLCKRRRPSNIPNFDADTGMWIKTLDLDLVKSVYDKAQSYYPKESEIHQHQIVKALTYLNIEFTCCNQNVCFGN